MSYFNNEQEDYMTSLNKMPLETKCWCGWNKFGECQNCEDIKETCADKVKLMCPDCENYPRSPQLPVYHRKGCKQEV